MKIEIIKSGAPRPLANYNVGGKRRRTDTTEDPDGKTYRYAADYVGVCTENSVRIDYVTESPNVSGDDRSVVLLPGPVRLAIQVEGPT